MSSHKILLKLILFYYHSEYIPFDYLHLYKSHIAFDLDELAGFVDFGNCQLQSFREFYIDMFDNSDGCSVWNCIVQLMQL